MYNGKAVIDIHGHMSTPPHFRAFAYNLVALRTPDEMALAIPEPAMKAALDRHLRLLDERKVDLQLISPRPVAMMHWERPFLVEAWTKATNSVIAQQCRQHPTRFAGVAQLPQTRDLNINACVAELEHCVNDLGFVGAIVNPDPGGDRKAPGLNDRAWYPLYEKAEELNATLVVHPSISLDTRLDGLPHSYQYNNMTEETLATLLLEHGNVFRDFPKLRVVVCHCGGCLRRTMEVGEVVDASKESRGPDNVIQSSGERAGGSATEGPAKVAVESQDWSDNLFFDTCAYDPWFLGAAIRQRGPRRMAFGTEAPGSGSASMNPLTGKPADDILATLEQMDFLDTETITEIVHDNPRKIFPLLERLDVMKQTA
jgi:predicted TIM-barrel fold metal-dependent hydrolase